MMRSTIPPKVTPTVPPKTASKILGGSHVVLFGTTSIPFDLLYSARKTLSLRVYPDSTIQVDAPLGTDFTKIEAFVKGRGAWILRQLKEIKRYEQPQTPLPRQYVSGESYRYRGRQYRLKVVEDPIERVVLSRGWLTIGLPHPEDRDRVKALLSAWYQARAEQLFTERLDVCFAKVEPLGIPRPLLAIRLMVNRWGSCSPKQRITLNLKLIQAPIYLIDYVIFHELCHLKEPNHSPQFWALLTRVLPSWERLRDELNKYEFGTF